MTKQHTEHQLRAAGAMDVAPRGRRKTRNERELIRVDPLLWILRQCVVEGDCWIWQGRYLHGRVPVASVSRHEGEPTNAVSVARWAYEEYTQEPVPSDRVIYRSVCMDHRCVLPLHGTCGTPLERTQHNIKLGRLTSNYMRRIKTAQWARANLAKLTWPQACEIRRLRPDTGVVARAREIGAEYGVSVHVILGIWRGISWRPIEASANPFGALAYAVTHQPKLPTPENYLMPV